MRYTVVLEPAEEGGYLVSVPSFPAIVTQGETVEEALTNAREAIELELDLTRERGESLPTDHGVHVHEVEVPLAS